MNEKTMSKSNDDNQKTVFPFFLYIEKITCIKIEYFMYFIKIINICYKIKSAQLNNLKLKKNHLLLKKNFCKSYFKMKIKIEKMMNW